MSSESAVSGESVRLRVCFGVFCSPDVEGAFTGSGVCSTPFLSLKTAEANDYSARDSSFTYILKCVAATHSGHRHSGSITFKSVY